MNTENRMWSVRLFAGAIMAGLLVIVTGCGGDDEQPEYQHKSVRADLVTAARTTIPRTVMATGTLQAQNSVEVSTRLMGHVREVLVREGETVTKGQVLVRIDDTDGALTRPISDENSGTDDMGVNFSVE